MDANCPSCGLDVTAHDLSRAQSCCIEHMSAMVSDVLERSTSIRLLSPGFEIGGPVTEGPELLFKRKLQVESGESE